MERQVIYEYKQLGNTIKVTAVDVDTGIEVSTVVPTQLTQMQMNKAAYQKLLYVLEKR